MTNSPRPSTQVEVDNPQAMIAHNLRLLREARGPKIVLMSEDALAAAGSSIELFVEALAIPHMRTQVERHNAHVVGVHVTGDQLKGAIAYYDQQEQAKTEAILKNFRRGWRRARNARQPYAAGIFLFVLKAQNLTPDELKAQLIPPAKHVSVQDYRHPSGLLDKMVLVSSDPEGLAELEFKTAITHTDRVHPVTATVLDTADPEGQGRIRMCLRFLNNPNAPMESFPWCPRSPDPTTPLRLPQVGSTVIAELRINVEGEYNISWLQ